MQSRARPFGHTPISLNETCGGHLPLRRRKCVLIESYRRVAERRVASLYAPGADNGFGHRLPCAPLRAWPPSVP